MNRRELLTSALGVGFGVISANSTEYFSDWERKELDYGTHYWMKDGKTCYEYKDYTNARLLSIYTIHEVGELDQFILKTEVNSQREAAQLIERIDA